MFTKFFAQGMCAAQAAGCPPAAPEVQPLRLALRDAEDAMTVGDVCTRSVVTATPDETIVDAARRMRDHHVGTVVVVDGEKRRPADRHSDRP